MSTRDAWWLLAAAVAAVATSLCVVYATPVDRALPFIAVVITLVAAASHDSVAVGVPLLIGGEIAIGDERMRLMWFGVVIAIAFAGALASGQSRLRAVVCTVGAILILRWIPFADVRVVRELFLILIAVGIVAGLRYSAFGVVVAVITALFTPAMPLRTFMVPLMMLLICGAARVPRAVGRHGRRSTDPIFATLLAIPLFFFAWSGAFARTYPIILRGPLHQHERFWIRLALAPGESALLDVPSNARSLVLSGANMPRLKPHTVVGQVNAMPIRIGDIADWGAFRREDYYASRNSLPHNAAGMLRGYGYSAWIDGAGRIPASGTHMRVTADAALPRDARLQIEAFELDGQ